MFVLAFLLVAIFYITAIIIEPEDPTAQNQQVDGFSPGQILSPKEPFHIDSIDQIVDFTYQFPAPLLFLQETESIQFVQGDMYDLAYNQGFARVARLIYTVNDQGPVTLTCIYPRDAFSLLNKEQYHLLTNQEYLGAFAAVRMENGESARLHAQGNLGLYAFTLPAAMKDQLTPLGRSAVFLSQPFSEDEETPAP